MVLTREVLEKYSTAEREIERINEKIEYWSKYVVPSEHGIVKGSMADFPYAERHFEISAPNVKQDNARQEKLKNLMILLHQRQEEYINLSVEVAQAIESIDDPEIRFIIDGKYLKGMTYSEIGAILYTDRGNVCRKLTQFLDKKSATE